MELLPIFINIRKRNCVIIGGGEVAYRKAVLLTRAGADLTIISETISPQLSDLCSSNNFKQVLASFDESQLIGAVLVIAATDNLDVNKRVSAAAGKLNIPVNVVDQPALCSFIVPSIVDRTPIVIAISSSGSSPVLIRKLKELNELQLSQMIAKRRVTHHENLRVVFQITQLNYFYPDPYYLI